MISPLDLSVLLSVFISFAVFILLKIIVLRMVHPEAVLRGIVNIFIAASLIHISCLAVAYSSLGWAYPGGVLFMAAVSYGCFGLMAFVYIVCVFGPSETSIRIRLVRELSDARGGRLSHEELLRRYNGRMILERRLQRLALAGEIIERQGKYVLLGKANAFFLIDTVAGWIQKILKRSS